MAVEKRAATAAVRAAPSRAKAPPWIRARDVTWRTFASVKVALILILVLAALTLIGTLVSQVPGYIKVGSPDYAAWLKQAEGRFGIWTGLMDRLQLFYVFKSVLFYGTGLLLIANIVVCALDRWKGIWASIARNRVRMSDGFYKYAPVKLTAAQPPAEASETLRRLLRGSRYRVQVVEEAGSYYLFSDRNRLARFGTYMSHLGLILLIAGFITGQVVGWRNDAFIITEGETQPVGYGTNFSVHLEQFADEWYLSGPPKDYRSDVVLYENGQEVKQGTIRVNHPMSYGGVRLFQSFYGTSAMMRVQDQAGSVLFDGAVPLAWKYKERNVGSFSIPGEGVEAWVVATQAGVADTLVRPGEMRIEVVKDDGKAPIAVTNLAQGQPQEVAGLTYTFVRERQFTGLQVARDPTVNLVWVAFTLMTVGVALVLYLPHRRLWSAVRPTSDGGSELALRGVVGRDSDFEEEMNRVTHKLRSALSKQ